MQNSLDVHPWKERLPGALRDVKALVRGGHLPERMLRGKAGGSWGVEAGTAGGILEKGVRIFGEIRGDDR